MNYETDLSTQQNPAQKDFWIPGQNENEIRAQTDQQAPPSRQKKTCSLTLPKKLRLLRRGEFLRVSREGKRLVGRFLCIDYRPAKRGRLGISASNRYGSAPERNRFKRLIREAYRQSYSSLPPYELNIIPRQCAKKASCTNILDEIRSLLKCN